MTLTLGLFAGCGKGPSAPAPLPGMAAMSRDRLLQYSIVPSRDAVAVKNVKSGKLLAEIPVGRAPEQILVGPDDTVYVTNRGSRSVSVISRGRWKEAQRLNVGVEPVGLALSPDNQTLYVVNSASFESADAGTLTALDLRSGEPRWELPVGEEPRSVVLNGTTAEVVSKDGEKVKVDLKQGRIVEEPKRPTIEADRAGPRAELGAHGTAASLASMVH